MNPQAEAQLQYDEDGMATLRLTRRCEAKPDAAPTFSWEHLQVMRSETYLDLARFSPPRADIHRDVERRALYAVVAAALELGYWPTRAPKATWHMKVPGHNPMKWAPFDWGDTPDAVEGSVAHDGSGASGDGGAAG